MNDKENPGGTDMTDTSLDVQLRLQLKALRRDNEPAHDLWPGISARIAQTPLQVPQPSDLPLAGSRTRRHRTGRWRMPVALAASLAVALGVAWQLRPSIDTDVAPPATGQPHGASHLLPSEAAQMSREYDLALRQLQDAGDRGFAANADLRELDRSAEQIRAAMREDPHARFLLDRLRSTYAKRLQLTQRQLES